MDTWDYQFLANLMLQHSGLSLGTGKEYLLEARLIPVAQSWGLAGISDLTRELRKGDERLRSAVIEAMTTNETLFFRDKTPFDELREKLLPPILAARQSLKHLRVWSAAASTGQELYSLAMLIRDSFPDVARSWRIEIVGTDISAQALARAQTGIYTQFEVQRGLPIQLLMRHFKQVPEGWKISDELRPWIQFKKLNLLDPFQFLGQFDVIFCRNVLIYFENDLKRNILDRMARQLAHDGCLILGAAESVIGVTDAFERQRDCRAAVYIPKSRLSVSA
jgi:chemotaxis protein methyltransferase CheR